VVGVQVRDAVHRIVLWARIAASGRRGDRVHVTHDRIVGDDQAVHYDERVNAAVDGGDAAQVDLAAAPGSARVHLDQGAGDLALQRTLDRLHRRPVQLLGGHGGHGVREVPLLHPGRLPGHHDRLEIEDVGLEAHAHAGLIPGHSDLTTLVADGADRQRHGASGPGKRELAAIVRDGRDRSAYHRDRGPGDGLGAGRTNDFPGAVALLTGRDPDREAQRERDKREALYHDSSRPGAQWPRL